MRALLRSDVQINGTGRTQSEQSNGRHGVHCTFLTFSYTSRYDILMYVSICALDLDIDGGFVKRAAPAYGHHRRQQLILYSMYIPPYIDSHGQLHLSQVCLTAAYQVAGNPAPCSHRPHPPPSAPGQRWQRLLPSGKIVPSVLPMLVLSMRGKDSARVSWDQFSSQATLLLTPLHRSRAAINRLASVTGCDEMFRFPCRKMGSSVPYLRSISAVPSSISGPWYPDCLNLLNSAWVVCDY
jgi:hypothetical protein